VTKLLSSLDDELQKEKPSCLEIEVMQQGLDRHFNMLMDLDEQVMGLMLGDEDVKIEDLRAERAERETFIVKTTHVKQRIQIVLYPPSTTKSNGGGSGDGSITPGKRNFRLPKIELRKFSGELKEWLGWWAQFEKIHEDEELHDADKMTYLRLGMKEPSRAFDVVDRFPPTPANYPKAVLALKERFGKPKLLKQVYVRELIKMILDNKTKDKTPLSTLYDRLESSLRSLESLGVSTDQMGEFLFPMVESSLPEEILLAWQRSPLFGQDGSREIPPKSELDFLMEFLKTEIDNEEQRKLAGAGFGFDAKGNSRSQKKREWVETEEVPTAAGLFSGSAGGFRPNPNCIFCDKGHPSQDCFKAQRMTAEERKSAVQTKGACFTCLKVGHTSKSKRCKRVPHCPNCGKKHVLLFCPVFTSKKSQEANGNTGQVQTVLTTLNCTSEVLLQTLLVRVTNPVNNKSRLARVLLDNGSHRSYILEKTAKELGMRTQGTVRVNHELFGGVKVDGQLHQIYCFNIGSVRGKFSLPVVFMDNPCICGPVPRFYKGSWMTELQRKGIFVPDVDPKQSEEIEILIGSDHLGDILTGSSFQMENGLYATETKFGWTVMGRLRRSETAALSVLTMNIFSSTVTDLWNLETIGILDPAEVKSREEREAEAHDHFVKTVKRNDEGRYSVSLPWTNGKTLPSNREVTEKRLVSTSRRLNSLHKFASYDCIFKEWEAEGIISAAEEAVEPTGCHYLPQRAVFKESRTTPVRPVFDASCKVGRSPSLNGCLEKGPNFLELIPAMLLRFRMGRIGVIADIRKAFLMIEVDEEDRDYLRFLWWEDSTQTKVKVYRHNRVVFGMNCSPFLLAAVITHHLNLKRTESPHVVDKIQNSLYVDNLVTVVDSNEDYEEIRYWATRALGEAKMELRQWERSGVKGESRVTGVLGMKWDKMSDVLFCEAIPHAIPLKITKRIILSQIQRIFDPLGILSPALIVPKALLQTAWMENKQWDEEVSEELKIPFCRWWEEMSGVLDRIRIPRNCTEGFRKEDGRFQLHSFSDASKKAYAVVVFLRVEAPNGVRIHFLQSKARVAPTKTVTIPRLELLSCTISARLTLSIKKALDLVDVPTYYWNDSTTALSWIRNSDAWGTFVGNRVMEIVKLTEPTQWKYVPGTLNPADLPSRGISPAKLVKERWWEGPEWLKGEESSWPTLEPDVDEEEVNKERKKGILTLAGQTSIVPCYIMSKSYHKNLQIMSLAFRFLDAAKKNVIHKAPSVGELVQSIGVEELNMTERRLFKLVQMESFAMDEAVTEGLRVEKDQEGILRVKTKLLHREDSLEFRKPILLPNSHPLVDMMIMDEHLQNGHGGIQFLMGMLREKVWIIKGKRTVRKVVHSCVRCRRFEARKVEVPICALPTDRVQSGTAFATTGVDLAGPLTLRNDTKVYIVLYTCAVYRGVHLEVVESLSTEDFLLSFYRFCWRKTRPTTVYSDNGTNFVGAVNLFLGIDWARVEEETKAKRIKWKFNPPAAPWWGGWWERLIRSVKDLLKRMLGNKRLNYVELETSLCEVESVINHRPLTCVTEDQDDLVPLTPAMFITDLPITDVPEEDLFPIGATAGVLTQKKLGVKRKSLTKLLDELKERFRKEYLGQLIQRGKEQKTRMLKVGDIVLMEKANQKRVLWPMARIEELFPGKDGQVRTAMVRTKTGRFLRPLQRLFPLEVDTTEFIPDPRFKKEKKVQAAQDRPIPKEAKARPPKVDSRIKSDPVPEEVVTRRGRVVKKPCKLGD